MRRKLIKQGKSSLTISLPKKWINLHKLSSGDSVDVELEDNDLIIKNDSKKPLKKTEIELNDHNKETFRSLIGSLYRGGYDEIKVKYDDDKILINLQDAVDSILGFEIVYIEKKSCIIKSIYDNENAKIKPHIKRIIHSIFTIQEMIHEDLKNNEKSTLQIKKLRNNVLKNRDLIIRIIKKQKLLDDSSFPYYTITLSLWGVTRNYYKLHKYTDNDISKQDLKLLKETNQYVKNMFKNLDKLNKKEFLNRHNRYEKIHKKALELIKENKSLIPSFCLNIIIETQLSDSQTYLLNHNGN